MHKVLVAVLAFSAAGLTPLIASSDDTPCCQKPAPAAASATAGPPTLPALPVPPATAPAGYEPTAHAGVFVRSVPAPPATPASAAGQVLMLPGGAWPVPPPTTEADVPPVPFVTPEGATIVMAPPWLRAYATITLESDGKPRIDCAQPSGPPVAAASPSDSAKKEAAR